MEATYTPATKSVAEVQHGNESIKNFVLSQQVADTVQEHLDELQTAILSTLASSKNSGSGAQVNHLTQQSVQHILSALVSNNALTEAAAKSIKHNLQTMKTLSPVTQLATVKQILTQVQTELGTQLNDKSLSSAQVAAVKHSLGKIHKEQEQLNTLTTTTTNQMLGATNLGSTPPPSDIVFNTIIAPTSGAPNITSMDGPTAAMFVMIWMAEGPISDQMNTNSQQIVDLGNESNVVSNTATQLKDILGFMTSNAGNTTVNVFYAFYDWMQNNPQLANSPLLGTLSNAVANNMNLSQSTNEAFANSNNALFTSMYDQLQQLSTQFAAYNYPTITAAMLAGGDASVFTPGTTGLNTTNITYSPQQIFMTYWVQPANAASVAISGLTSDDSNAVYQNMWTDAGAEQQSSSSNMYAQNSLSGNQFYQLTFNATNVSAVIGSNSAQETGGALQVCTQAQTTSNTTNSALMATQTYLGNQFSNAINTGISILNDLKFNF